MGKKALAQARTRSWLTRGTSPAVTLSQLPVRDICMVGRANAWLRGLAAVPSVWRQAHRWGAARALRDGAVGAAWGCAGAMTM